MPRLTRLPCAKFERDAFRDDRLRIHGSPVGDEVVDERRGRHDVVGRDDADGHDVLGGDDDGVAAIAMTGLKLRAVSA